jgi:beta-N-acetylhexosaminidase
VAADFERGASMRVAETTRFPHLMAFAAAGDIEGTRFLGQATAREARALGVHWVFAPVADVNNNPDNPIINIRSFGQDPATVAAHVRAFIRGAHSGSGARVLVTAKHFPGHGDTATDSHLGLPSFDADRARLFGLELVPFRAAIEEGVDAVMTAHISVPALEPEPIPATVSARILSGILRDQLRFQGIIITDAMDMQGLTKQFSPGEAAVRAIGAGADVLLMSPEPDKAIAAVLAAVESGRLSRKRIQESVERVLAAKTRVGLTSSTKMVDVEAISDRLNDPDDALHAQQVADRAVTLAKNSAAVMPLAEPGAACYIVLRESRASQRGLVFLDQVRERAPRSVAFALDPQMSGAELERIVLKLGDCPAVVVAGFVSVAAYRGDVALDTAYSAMLAKLTAAKPPVILVSLGNPYLLRNFPGVAAYLATFSTAATSEIAAVKAVFGEIPIQGRLPVSIPGFAKIGDGILLPAQNGRRQQD